VTPIDWKPALKPYGWGQSLHILVPNYRAGSNWLIPFIFSLEAHSSYQDIVFYIIINTNAEYPYFQRLLRMLPKSRFHFHFIVVEKIIHNQHGMPAALAHLQAGANNGIAGFKKMTGLLWASTHLTENFICVDAETVNTRSLQGFRQKIDANHDDGRYFGRRLIETDPPLYAKINRTSLAVLGAEAARSVTDKEMHDIYTWFFDVPIYSPQTLKNMFAHLEVVHGGLEGFFMKLDWFVFEHIVYLYWRVHAGEASIVEYSPLGVTVMPENLTYMDRFAISSAAGYESLWHLADLFVSAQYEAPSSGYPYFLFHLDRMFRR
jgi:hypothetical protein